MRYNIRKMRKSLLASSLFSSTLQRIMAATVLRPEREWYLSDLATHLGVRPSSLQRAVGKLTRGGILQRRKDGNRVYYRVARDCPIYEDLAGILIKTIGIVEPIRAALEPFAGRIHAAFIHGSVAEDRERSQSDIDLVIVGEASSADLAFVLRPLGERLGREINFMRYSADEFASKVASGHHFISSVLRKKRIWLIGDEHDLEKAAHRPLRRA